MPGGSARTREGEPRSVDSAYHMLWEPSPLCSHCQDLIHVIIISVLDPRFSNFRVYQNYLRGTDTMLRVCIFNYLFPGGWCRDCALKLTDTASFNLVVPDSALSQGSHMSKFPFYQNAISYSIYTDPPPRRLEVEKNLANVYILTT